MTGCYIVPVCRSNVVVHLFLVLFVNNHSQACNYVLYVGCRVGANSSSGEGGWVANTSHGDRTCDDDGDVV